MLKSIYLYSWILAFNGFMVFFLSFLIVKKNELVNISTILAAMSIVWILSALALRLGIGPSAEVWFQTSVIILLATPYLLYFLIAMSANESLFNSKTILLSFMCLAGIFMAVENVYFDPVFIYSPNTDKTSFMIHNLVDVVKNPQPFAILLVFGPTVLVGCGIKVLHDHKDMEYRSLTLFGMIAYWILNLLYIYSESFFPYELATGIMNGIILVYIMKKRKIINFGKRVHRIIFPIFALIIVLLFCLILCNSPWGMPDTFKETTKNVIIFTALVTTSLVAAFEILFSKFFFDKEDHILKCMSEYNEELLPVLGNIDDIASIFRKALKAAYEVNDIALYIWNEKTRLYQLNGVADYDRKTFAEADDIVYHARNLRSPQSAWNILEYLEDGNSRLAKAIESRKLSIFSPLNSGDKVIGFYFMGGGRDLDVDDIDRNSLNSINRTTAKAIENSQMMHDLAHDAITDPLTGLYDRNAVESLLGEYRDRGEAFILLLFNIDDMKLFNLVYSMKEGNKLIKVFADTLRKEADGNATLGRISGRTFSALYHGTYEDAVDYDRRARKAFAYANKGTNRSDITFSTGLLAVEEGDQRNAEELLNDVKRAAVQAKRNGKDTLYEYNACMAEDPYRYDLGVRVDTVDAISKALDLRDHLTYEHSDNVATYARCIAESIGLDPLSVQVIYEAGLVHDIGKISIPDSVLLNTGRLTDEEYEIMKSHVERGREVIASLPYGSRMVPIAMSHHERWDGKGYPAGLKGEEIPIGGRCLAIADAFDAMTSRRIYKKAISVDAALEEILGESGSQFDPELGPVFVRLVKEGRIIPRPYL